MRDPARAEALAAAVRAAGHGGRIDTHDGGFTWIVYGDAPESAGEWFAALAAGQGAEYEGWDPAAEGP